MLKGNGQYYHLFNSEKEMVREESLDVLQYLSMTLPENLHLLLCIDMNSIDNFPKDINIHRSFHIWAAFRVVVNGLLYPMLSKNQETKELNYYFYSLPREHHL